MPRTGSARRRAWAIGPWLGLLLGVSVSLLLSFVLALFHLDLKGDLFLSGIALNIFGSSATIAILFELTGDRGNTSTLASLQMPFIQLPEFIREIPLLGGFVFDVFNNQSVMTWIAFIAVFVVAFFLYRTPIGMHLRAVGENPEAAASVGINVKRIRYLALLISGLFAGLGGIHMSMGYLQLFQRDMTNGRGFIALVTPSLGGGTPVGTMIALVGIRLLRRAWHPHWLAGDSVAAAAIDPLLRDGAGAGDIRFAAAHLAARQ